MIEHLRSALGAYFYIRTARITKKAVHALFDAIVAEADNAGRPLFRVERATQGDVRYSALCLAHDRLVPFLDPAARKVDRVHGFILVVESGGGVAVLRSGLDVTATFRKAHLAPVGRGSVERAIARHDAVFEKLSLRNMTVSKLALRSKTLEARDLENAIATSSASRFVPQNYRVRRDDGSYSATPSTGRIALRADRTDVEGAVDWAADVIDLLAEEAAASSAFIRRFARPAELDAIHAGTPPTFFAVDTMALADAVWEAQDRIRLVREEAGAWVELTKVEVQDVLEALDYPLAVTAAAAAGDHQLRDDADAAVGAIRVNRSRIALRSLDIPAIADLHVERADHALGGDPDRQALVRHLDGEDMFTVLFADQALAYIDGALFRDEELLGGGAAFMRHLVAEPALVASTSEKGDFAAGQTAFSPTSVFRAVVDVIAKEDVLVCDDLGDEWADFIGVSTGTSPTTVTFYHAKHGATSLGASAFHDAVGQGIKNLGRLGLGGEAMAIKHACWDANYKADKVATAIARRMRGGTREEVEEKIAEATMAPDVQRRVLIVTSSLSRAAVQAAFDAAHAGIAPKPNFVQLYWLLTGFFSACAEIGAVGFVVCKP
ncbi:MAG TPA: hypothetical protein VEC11_08525 [Allosphingosinicella sp.]|nr:hypothetical protein [Allosphingosinicella sp.]